MDCSLGNGAGHFLFPNEYDILYKPLQSENSCQWGGYKCENMGMESLNRDQTSEVHYGIPGHLTENFGSKGLLQQNTLPYEQPRFLLNERVGDDNVDNIFMRQLLDEDAFMESSSESFGVCHEFQHDSMTTIDDRFFKTVLESPSVPSYLYGVKNINDFKLDEFPPSWDGNMEEHAAFPSAVSTFGGTKVATSNEESVLRELEGVIMQMDEKTRIYFRDALYQLAKDWEQQESNVANFTVEPTRTGMSIESKTNAIDRIMVNLLFSNMKISGEDVSMVAGEGRETQY